MSQSHDNLSSRGRGRVARFALAGALTVGALATVPVAQANTLVSVRAHVHGADSALHGVVGAAAIGASVSGPLADLKKELRAAGHDSARLYKHAHSSVARVHAATALTKLAAQQSRDATVLTPLLGTLTGSGQTDIAGLVASATQGREQALTLVTQLLGKLPTSAQAPVAGVLAQLSNAGLGQVGSLAGSFSPGSIACPAIDAVSQVVVTVLAAVQADLTRVQSMLPVLPAGAAAQFTGVLNGLPTQLTSLVASLKQAFGCSSTSPAGSPATGPLAIVGPLLGSVTQIVQGLLSSVLPSVGAGQVTPSLAAVGPVSGLLGSVTSLVPSIGGLLGGGSGSPVGGLLGSGGLLGGLLGGILGH